MNCQQAENLIEDVIDGRLSDCERRNLDEHLAQCAFCRGRFAAERREHAAWVHALNDPAVAHETLPVDITHRLVSATFGRRPLLKRLTRTGLVAAGLSIMAAFAALGAWFAADVLAGPGETEGLSDELVRKLCAEAVADIENLNTNTTQKGTTMKPAVAAVSVAIGTSTLPVGFLQASHDNSCIISGSTERHCAMTAWDDSHQSSLDSRVWGCDFGQPFAQFESRSSTQESDAPLARFRSDKPSGFTIIIH